MAFTAHLLVLAKLCLTFIFPFSGFPLNRKNLGDGDCPDKTFHKPRPPRSVELNPTPTPTGTCADGPWVASGMTKNYLYLIIMLKPPPKEGSTSVIYITYNVCIGMFP